MESIHVLNISLSCDIAHSNQHIQKLVLFLRIRHQGAKAHDSIFHALRALQIFWEKIGCLIACIAICYHFDGLLLLFHQIDGFESLLAL